MNSPTKLIPLILTLMMSATLQASASPCGDCEKPNPDPYLALAVPCVPKDEFSDVPNEPCKECDGHGNVRNKKSGTAIPGEDCKECDGNGGERNKRAGTAIPGEDCKECDGNGGERDKQDNTPCSSGLVCCQGMCIGLPQNCGICETPNDCIIFMASGLACLPDDGKKCKEDECKPGQGIHGAQLKLTPPTYQLCKNEPVSVDTGNPTDRDYILYHRCKNRICVPKRKHIPGTVKTGKVEMKNSRIGRQAARTYKVEFTSECGDRPVKLRKFVFILDCPEDFYQCTDWCDRNTFDPGGIANCYFYCAINYEMCKRKCEQYGL